MVRALVLVGILGLVFVVVLPRIVDYDEVRAALAALTGGQLALLAATTAVAYLASAAPWRVLVPALSWPHAVGANLAAGAVVTTVPGPTDIATRFVLYRQWSIPTATATAAIVFAPFFENLASLALPLIAAIGLLASGREAPPRVLSLALICLIVAAIATLLLVALLRSESLARAVGGGLQRLVQRIWKAFRKTPPTGIAEGVLDLRERSMEVLSQHGPLAFAAAVAAKVAWFVVLEVSLWAVGISPDVLPPAAVLAAIGIVSIVALVPITPGGAGVSEVTYIAVLASVAGTGLTEQITAAVMLFRIAQWLAPIPIGWVLLFWMRRGHWGELLGSQDTTAAASSS